MGLFLWGCIALGVAVLVVAVMYGARAFLEYYISTRSD